MLPSRRLRAPTLRRPANPRRRLRRQRNAWMILVKVKKKVHLSVTKKLRHKGKDFRTCKCTNLEIRMSLPWNPTCPVQFESNKHEFLAIPSDDSCPHCRTSCLTAHSPPLTPLHRLCPSLKFVFVMMAALVHLWQWATIFGAWILRHQQLKKRWLESVGIKCLSKMENKLHANTCSTSCAES